MATRSYICIETSKGKYKGIYCHNDGYPEYVGQTLFDHYKIKERVETLLALGDISSLGYRISDAEPPMEGDGPESNITYAYARDRGEVIKPAHEVALSDFKDQLIEYVYIFNLSGEWIYYQTSNLSKSLSLKEELKKIKSQKAVDKLWN